MSCIPFTVQILDQETEEWSDLWHLHARKVNKSGGGMSTNAGADQYRATLTFEVPWFSALEAVRYKPQFYRIIYRGHAFKLADYDDYMERHLTVNLVGEAYG